jgi:outer membrane immunogenic protein
MRRFLFGTAALILLASPAVCDDARRPVYKAPPVAPSWHCTGCYAGGHADGLWGRSSQWIVRTPGGAFFGQSLGEHEVEGWGGGAQAGCDYQFAGGFVIGVQGDYALMGGGAATTAPASSALPITAAVSRSHRSPAASATLGIAFSAT